MGDENRNTYNIGNIGGNFNQSIPGNYIQVHGNYIDMGQDLSQAAAQIQQLLTQLQSNSDLAPLRTDPENVKKYAIRLPDFC